MVEGAASEPCADCLALVDRVGALHYPGYDPATWDRLLGPHPHLTRADATPFQCRACRCCWSLDENPDCGYIDIERLSELEYCRRLRPSRWNPPFCEGRWGVVVLLYAPLLVASTGLAAAVVWYSASAGSLVWTWPTVLVLSGLAFASGWGLVRAVLSR